MPVTSETTTTSCLVRLYDLASDEDWSAAGTTRPAQHGDVTGALALVEQGAHTAQVWLAFASDPIRAAVATSEGRIVGCCLYDAARKGTLGPLFTAPGPGSAQLRSSLVRAGCRAMLRAGYWYAVADESSIGDRTALPAEATVAIPARPPEAPSRRDTPDPWTDLFIPLDSGLDLPPPLVDGFEVGGRTVHIRRPRPSDRIVLTRWAADQFGDGWASEVAATFQRQPISVMVATASGRLDRPDDLLGFMVYGVTAPGTIGPTALCPPVHGTPAAAVLLDRCLRELRRDGFDYAILGGISRRRGALRALTRAWAIPGSYPALFPADKPTEVFVDD
jgi:hypothetical protein